MSQPITSQEIQDLIDGVKAGNITAAYDFLINRGYQYASWVNGVAKGDTLAGASALVFLESTALMGMGINSLACQTLSPATLQNIKQGMAREYLNILADQAKTAW